MDRVCPLLALAADRRTAVDGVDGGHRCHALEPPAALERDRQSRLCLTPAHQRCERYLAYLGRGGSPQPGGVAIATMVSSVANTGVAARQRDLLEMRTVLRNASPMLSDVIVSSSATAR